MTYDEALLEAGIEIQADKQTKLSEAIFAESLFEEMTVNEIQEQTAAYGELTMKDVAILEAELKELDEGMQNTISEAAKGMTSITGYIASGVFGIPGVLAYYFYKKSRKEALIREVRRYCGNDAAEKVSYAYDDKDENVIKKALQCVIDKKSREK